MAMLMLCIELANGEVGPGGQWLEAYDQETGESVWTNEREKAIRFSTARAAFECWRSVHRRDPVRADGKPNRPLTAFTVSFEEA